MADCGDSPYQAIEYRGLFDLKDAQIVRAEIVTIDRIALTAEVTLLDECEFDDWLDMDAVPFFYHCETSTGTVEDLEKGHKAFVDGDMVYILLTKENGDAPAQAFIIGHIDIRGTRACTTDILLITQRFRNNSVWYVVYILINPVLGTLFDIAAFENFDGSSPAKPSSALGVYSTAVENWVNYNFVSVTNTIDVPFTRTSSTLFIPAPLFIYHAAGLPVEDSYTAYTGDYSATATPPEDACEDFDTGNGQDYIHWTDADGSVVGGDGAYGSYNSTEFLDRYGATTYHPGGDVQTCRILWDTARFNRATTINYGGPYGWVITDTVTSEAINIPIRMTFSWELDAVSVYDVLTTSMSVVYGDTSTYTYVFDFSELSGETRSVTYTFSAEAAVGDALAPGVGDTDAPTEVTGAVRDPSRTAASDYFPILWTLSTTGVKSGTGSVLLEGDDGVYSVFGGCIRQQWLEVTAGASTITIPSYGSTLYYDPTGGPAYNTHATAILGGTQKIRARPFLAAIVTPYDATFDLGNPISVAQCFDSAHGLRSAALANTIESLYTYIYDNYTQGINAYEVEALSNNYVGTYYGLAYGPTYRLIKKKV